MTIRYSLPLLAVALSLSGCAVSQQRYEAGRTALEGSPKLKQEAINQCTKDTKSKSSEKLKVLAMLANTSTAAVPKVLCTRVYNAWANGRLTYQDYKSGMTGNPTPATIKIIQGR
ncbi:hypothetical protein C0075_21790 [Rhizobium sp. KAs_5_22]|uniref:hypothetical protein n=1 Tax=Ciceribacter selenitireducens TaxID=448181 RepID=UPI0004920039|nr:hypothetical protein [Ciceribacter selenitireducens]PPJ48129.1 hypothetical protein C0075_21790 [Rhizobium sp. KAs_5_22]